ncbi:MAG: NAD-dependent epimerase/dehydratase family protein [Leptolyngbya sp. SIO1E4]|nr:NAD-dependent epimerase/dehydratase family protein [Leptolyngbya sp. SIO1E4]
MAKTCLVTGGLGFIGQYVVQLLLHQGAQVRILDLAQPEQPIAGVKYIQGSITDQPLVEAAMAGVDWVFHLAANAGLWSPRKQEFLTVNQIGTRNVMMAAHAAGVQRVVHTSTESILKTDKLKGPDITDESVRLTFDDMVGAYCQGKFLAEQEAFQAADRGLPVVIVNPTIPLGPGDRRLTPPSRMVLGFLNGDYPAFLNSTLNLVDARDVAIGHLLAAEKGQVGERYLLGNANLQLKELLQMLHDLTGLPMPQRQVPYWLALAVSVVQEWIADHITHRPPAAPLTGVRLAGSPMCFSSQKARQELGFTSRPLQASLADAICWYAERGLLQRQPTRLQCD